MLMRSRYLKRFWIIMLILTVLRIGLAAVFPLSSDEAYHWEWSRHPALGYYDHPPLTAYVILVFTTILGNNEVGVRMGAIVLMTLASVIMYKLGRDISGDERTAFWTAILFNVIPVTNVFFVYMSTDPVSVFFWVLCLWLAYRAVILEQKSCWYLFGLALGGALLSKFLNVLIVPAIGLFLLCSRKHRKTFAMKEPYIAGVIALALLAPFIWWNATHGWATFAFNFYRRQTGTFSAMRIPSNMAEYLLGQLLAMSPLFLVGGIIMAVQMWRRGLRKGNDEYIFITSAFSVVFIFFLIISVMRSVGAHWPAAAAIPLSVGLAYAVIKEHDALLSRFARAGVLTTVGILVLAYGLLFAAYLLPNRMESFASRFSRESDEVYELHGLEQASAEAEKRGRETDSIIITPSYAFCSMVSFYSPSQVQTHMFGKGAVHGLNYLFWDGDYSQFVGRNALWVYKEPPKADDLKLMNDSFESVGSVEVFGVEIGSHTREFYLVQCTNLIEYEAE